MKLITCLIIMIRIGFEIKEFTISGLTSFRSLFSIGNLKSAIANSNLFKDLVIFDLVINGKDQKPVLVYFTIDNPKFTINNPIRFLSSAYFQSAI